MKLTIATKFNRHAFFVSISRNLLDNVKEHCANLAHQLTTNPEIERWINSTYKNWVINEAPVEEVTHLEADAPAWAVAALEKGDLQRVNWTEALRDLHNIVDYFNHFLQTGGRIKAITVEQARIQQAEYHATLAKQQKDPTLDEDGMSIVMRFPDGYYWANVFGEKSLDREGKIMGHCVGSYYSVVSQGFKTIYSLRDPKNNPHITIEQLKKTVNQIKGKGNETVAVKYRNYIPEFLASLNLEYINVDMSGFTEEALTDVFNENGWLRDVSQGGDLTQLLTISTSLGILSVSEPRDNFAELLPVIGSQDVTHLSAVKMSKGLTLTLNGKSATIKYNSKLDPMLRLEAVLGQPLSIDDKARIVFALVKANLRQVVFYYFGINSYPLLYACTTTVSSDLPDSYELRVPTNVEQAATLAGIQFTKLVAHKGQVLFFLNDKNKIVLANPRLSKITATDYKDPKELSELYNVISGYDYGVLPKAIQLKIFSNKSGNTTKPTPRNRALTQEITYHNLPQNLRNAFSWFSSDFSSKNEKFNINDVVAEMDAGDIKSIFKKHSIKTSGYLYDYHTAFLLLSLMTNKEKAIQYLLHSTSLLRQFTAFASGLNSILSGMVARNKTRDTFVKEWNVINEHLPKLFPLAVEEKEALLSMKSTPAFKRFIKERF